MNLVEITAGIGLNAKKAAETEGGEFHSSCPACGGIDRFIMQPNFKMGKCNGRYLCRQCGIHGDSIQFCREFLGMSFQDAAKYVNANIAVSTFDPKFKIEKSAKFKPAMLVPPLTEWKNAAGEFVKQSQQALLRENDMLNWLSERGIPLEAVIKYQIGWNSKYLSCDREIWGLEPEYGEDGKPRQIKLPRRACYPYD